MSRKQRNRQKRARYTRTDGNMLIGGNVPSGQEASTIWWMGDDRWIFTPQNTGHVAAVTRATNLICNTIGTLPWNRLAGGPDAASSRYRLPAPRWLTDPMLLRPDSRFGSTPTPAANRLPASSFWSQFIRAALIGGCAYLIFEEGSDGEPVPGTVRVLHPATVTPVEEPYLHRKIGDDVETDFDGRFSLGGRPYRMIEMLNPLSPVDEYGCAMGVLDMHAAEYGIAMQQIAYEKGMFRSGVPAGYLKVSIPNYKKAQADELRQRWLESHGGDSRSIAVLNSTTDFQPLSFSPVDMAMIESRKLSLVDIANMFGVPVYFLNGGDSGGLTYSNAESRSRDFLQFTLAPWASAIEQTLSSLLPAGQFVAVNFDGLLRSDTATRYGAYSQALADGWLTINDVRLGENLPPMESGGPVSVMPDNNDGGIE